MLCNKDCRYQVHADDGTENNSDECGKTLLGQIANSVLREWTGAEGIVEHHRGHQSR